MKKKLDILQKNMQIYLKEFDRTKNWDFSYP